MAVWCCVTSGTGAREAGSTTPLRRRDTVADNEWVGGRERRNVTSPPRPHHASAGPRDPASACGGAGPAGPVRVPRIAEVHSDAARRDRRVPAADAKSGPGSGAAGARHADS
jgi:hypothetical protein